MAATTDEQEPEQRTATTKRFFRPLSSALAVKFRSISPWRRRPWVIDQHCPGRKSDDAEAQDPDGVMPIAAAQRRSLVWLRPSGAVRSSTVRSLSNQPQS